MTNETKYMREYMQNYYKENKEIVSKAQKKWQENNKEHLRNYMRE